MNSLGTPAKERRKGSELFGHVWKTTLGWRRVQPKGGLKL